MAVVWVAGAAAVAWLEWRCLGVAFGRAFRRELVIAGVLVAGLAWAWW
jgi:hypothetical protein